MHGQQNIKIYFIVVNCLSRLTAPRGSANAGLTSVDCRWNLG